MPFRLPFALVLLAAPAIAQAPPPAQPPATSPYARAIAAGYKALTLCSAMFTAGRSQQQVESLELTGTYHEYDKLLPTLRATIERPIATVAVAWDDAMEPRRARWNPRTGCTIAPIGTGPLPVPAGHQAPPPVAGADPRAWPLGDGGIAPRPVPALSKAIDGAFSAGKARTTGVLVVADGRVVAERYGDGFGPFTANRSWSVAKSIAGTLVGTAAHQGLVKTAEPARIPEWSRGDPRRAITLDHLLRMGSGLYSATAGNRSDAIYFGGTAVTEETVAWPLEVQPGSRFRYANNDILLAVRSLRAVLGEQRYADYPRTALFAPLGMNHTVAETDWRGNYILSSQVWTTARDLARFGLLYLNDGVAGGRRLLPQGWTRYVTAASGPQPGDRTEGYGATFWLLNRAKDVPPDTYGAFGNRGQFVIVVPSRRVVIVRRGEDAAGAGNQFDIARFTAEVLKAVP